MVGALVHQLTRNLKDSQIEDSAFAPYFVDHTAGVFPTAASGFPWTAASMQVKGDPIADLTEDLAADAATTKRQHNLIYTRTTCFYKYLKIRHESLGLVPDLNRYITADVCSHDCS